MHRPVWQMSKKQAATKMAFMWFVALLIGWLAVSSGYGPLWLFVLMFMLGGGVFGLRVVYLSERDARAAQNSRYETVYHAHEARNPTPAQPQNKLYVPKAPERTN